MQHGSEHRCSTDLGRTHELRERVRETEAVEQSVELPPPPPLVITKEEVERAAAILHDALATVQPSR
jgi:4-aminobutyrate aminotransferase-like enzyme